MIRAQIACSPTSIPTHESGGLGSAAAVRDDDAASATAAVSDLCWDLEMLIGRFRFVMIGIARS